MPFYQKRGKIPLKKHTQFLNKNGDLYWEELISRGGFSHIYSNVYHVHPPTAIKKIGEFKSAGNPIKMSTYKDEKTRGDIPDLDEHRDKILKEFS